MKRGERGSCQMQMTSLGEGRRGGGEVAVWWGGVGRVLWRGGGALQFIFSIQRAPPPLLYCPSVWQLELAMWRGEQKRARCPARVRIGRHPTFKKKKRKKAEPTRRPVGTESEAEHTQTDSTFFFKSIPETPKTPDLVCDAAAKLKLSTRFCYSILFFVFFRGAKICSILTRHRVTLFTSCSPHTHWHPFFFRNYSESEFGFLAC